MERYYITTEEKKEIVDEFNVLNCPHSIGVKYDETYTSIKCKLSMGACMYKNSLKEEYKNCKFFKENN